MTPSSKYTRASTPAVKLEVWTVLSAVESQQSPTTASEIAVVRDTIVTDLEIPQTGSNSCFPLDKPLSSIYQPLHKTDEQTKPIIHIAILTIRNIGYLQNGRSSCFKTNITTNCYQREFFLPSQCLKKTAYNKSSPL